MSAEAAPRVDRYVPNNADPGARVRIEGRDFGSRKPQHTIRYGTTGTPIGTATIRSWTQIAIEVDLLNDDKVCEGNDGTRRV